MAALLALLNIIQVKVFFNSFFNLSRHTNELSNNRLIGFQLLFDVSVGQLG